MTGTEMGTGDGRAGARKVWRKALPYAIVLAGAGAAKPLARVLWEMFWFTDLSGFVTCLICPSALLGSALVSVMLAAKWREVMAWTERLSARIEGPVIPIVLAVILIPMMAIWGYRHDHLRPEFAQHRAALAKLVDANAAGSIVAPTAVGRWKVEKVVPDPRGGVYLATGTFAHGIDAGTLGFAYKPNATGTPFGNAGYELLHLEGDWYLFRANNDY